MELREKPGKIQKLMELLLRFRLIFVVIMIVLIAMFSARNWQGMISLPAAASEGFGIWFAGIESVQSIWASGQYIIVSLITSFVLLFVFCGIRGGIASIVGAFLFAIALFSLAGADSMVLPFFLVYTFLSLILLLFAKWGVACSLFPFAIFWLVLTGFCACIPIAEVKTWLVWAVFSAIAFSYNLAFSMTAEKLLSDGTPQAGAVVKSAKKMLLPLLLTALITSIALFFDMSKEIDNKTKVASAIIVFFIFVLWFYLFQIPILSFAPWHKLRSKERRVKMDKTKKK